MAAQAKQPQAAAQAEKPQAAAQEKQQQAAVSRQQRQQQQVAARMWSSASPASRCLFGSCRHSSNQSRSRSSRRLATGLKARHEASSRSKSRSRSSPKCSSSSGSKERRRWQAVLLPQHGGSAAEWWATHGKSPPMCRRVHQQIVRLTAVAAVQSRQ